MDGQSAQAYRRPCKGVAVALQAAQGNELYTQRGNQDGAEHGHYGDQAENRCYPYHAQVAAFGGRVHEQRNEGLAGAEDEYGEENPGSEVLSFLRMNVDVLLLVHVGMHMDFVVAVDMEVLVRLVPHCLPHTPDKVEETEDNKRPSGEAPTEGLERFEFRNRQAEGYAHKTQNDGAHYMPYAAKNGYPACHGRRPLSCPGHHNKGHIVIRAEKCVEKTN